MRTARESSVAMGATLLVAAACVARDEVARVPAPSGQAEAVVVETNGGATTSFGHNVYLVPPGRSWRRATEVARFYHTMRSDSAIGVTVRWEGSRRLAIEYVSSQRAELLIPVQEIDETPIEIVLREGVSDPTAPRGPMVKALRLLSDRAQGAGGLTTP